MWEGDVDAAMRVSVVFLSQGEGLDWIVGWTYMQRIMIKVDAVNKMRWSHQNRLKCALSFVLKLRFPLSLATSRASLCGRDFPSSILNSQFRLRSRW